MQIKYSDTLYNVDIVQGKIVQGWTLINVVQYRMASYNIDFSMLYEAMVYNTTVVWYKLSANMVLNTVVLYNIDQCCTNP